MDTGRLNHEVVTVIGFAVPRSSQLLIEPCSPAIAPDFNTHVASGLRPSIDRQVRRTLVEDTEYIRGAWIKST